MPRIKLLNRKYLKTMINTIGTPDIKVITGVRRSGKSKLLELFKKYIMINIENYNIIYINLSELKFEDYKEYHKLYNYVTNNFEKNKKNFLLIDEIQMCKGFELAINSFHAEEKYDIYITGSNAFLSSNDLATLFTGRIFEINIYPFSFKEYCQYYELNNIDNAFEDYLIDGGMSGSYLYNNESEKKDYISDIFRTLIVRDIIQKYNIKNEQLLYKLNDFLIDNISILTSTRKLTETLNNNKENTNHITIGNYINYLCNAYMYYKIKRYDIQGKMYLTSQDKYYLVDQSFKYALLGKKNINTGSVFENIVAIELLRRGYELYVGVLYNSEVDFVAIKRDEKKYIQVSKDISDKETFEREVKPLLQIKDAYPKYIIARTKEDIYTYEGIQIIDIARWLISEE